MIIDKYGRAKKIKNQNEEYQMKLINTEELGTVLEQQIQTRISPYSSIFDKFAKHGDNILQIPLKTSLSKEMTKKMIEDFFQKLDNDLYQQVKELFDVGENADMMTSDIVFEMRDDFKEGIGHCSKIEIDDTEFVSQFSEEILETIRESNPEDYKYFQKMKKPRIIIILAIACMGNTSDLYNLAHELGHYSIVKKSNYSGMMEEIIPHCMERLLDEYLLSLTEDECKKFGLNKEKIREDVILRNIISFAERYNNVKKFNKENKENGETAFRQEYLKYMLALIYQSQFAIKDSETKKKMILELINCIQNGNFNGINEILQIDWENKTQRQRYIDQPIDNVLKDFELYKKMIEEQKGKQCNSKEDFGEILL